MANLDDLPNEPFTELSTDEAIEMLRQVRLSRRTPVKKSKAPTKRKQAAITKDKVTNVDPAMAAELLKILGGTNQ